MMAWQRYVGASETGVFPWYGQRSLCRDGRLWRVADAPIEEGWYTFRLSSRREAFVIAPAAAAPNLWGRSTKGFIVGDRLVAGANGQLGGMRLDEAPRVQLLEVVDRFMPISVVTVESVPVFAGPAIPEGPEFEVARAFEDHAASTVGIRGVTPALDLAFRMETQLRAETAARRARLEQARRIAAISMGLGDGASRRELAAVDFAAAARQALAVGGAVYLDHQPAPAANEMRLRYRVGFRRLECVVDLDLNIVEAGICLSDGDDDGNDGRFTLESLPSVIREATQRGVLHVFHGFWAAG